MNSCRANVHDVIFDLYRIALKSDTPFHDQKAVVGIEKKHKLSMGGGVPPNQIEVEKRDLRTEGPTVDEEDLSRSKSRLHRPALNSDHFEQHRLGCE